MILWQSSYQNFDDEKLNKISNEIKNHISIENNKRNNYRNIDLNFYLYTNVLPKVDVASMANSLEVRPPYLDDRIQSYAQNNKTSNKTLKSEWEKILMLLIPLTPHLAHECCEKINKNFTGLNITLNY